MAQKYAFQGFNKELMARATGRDLAISTKQAIEISKYLRNRKLAQAKALLEKVIEKKQPIPFTRFTNALGHRRGKLAAGRYPVKAANAFLKLLESAEANAQTKGLNTGELQIIHICSHQAHRPMHYGRHHGREFKRTHVEVVLQETAEKKKKTERKEKREKPEQKEKTEKTDKPESKEESRATKKEEPAKEKTAEKKPEETPEQKKEEEPAGPEPVPEKPEQKTEPKPTEKPKPAEDSKAEEDKK